MSAEVPRHRTAMSRSALSRPLATALADALVPEGATVFDYGCGKGDDIRHLRALGFDAEGWDPTHRPRSELLAADLVNLGYVVNVIEHKAERADALRAAWGLARSTLVVTARLTWETRDVRGRPFADGVVTRSGTFQKFYEHRELAGWIEEVLQVKPLAAAPGIYYVFRDPRDAQRFLASRVHTYRPRVSIDPQMLYDQHSQELAPLLDFLRAHGRKPRATELPLQSRAVLEEAIGGLERAYRLIRGVTEDAYWDRVAAQRRSELLIYVALSRFSRRPRFTQLDDTLARDIRAHFGTYVEACLQADRMLLACGDQAVLYVAARSSPVGKQTPSALYVHRTALAHLPPVLQVYEGCARVLAGTLPSANMIKLSILEPQVSYLSYPEFDRNAHPTLATSLTVNLNRLSVDWRDYRASENPPLLHRKEEFLAQDDPRRQLYARLTRSELRAGLYAHPDQIGNLRDWTSTLASAGVRIRGHRLVRYSA